MSSNTKNLLRPRVGVGAVIFDASREQVLLIRRGHAPAAGCWSVPGGLVEPGESLAAACAREVEEETGMKVAVHPQPIKLIERVIRREGKVAHHYLIVDFIAEIVGGALRAGDDAAAAEWVALDALDRRPTTAGLKDGLRRAREVACAQKTSTPLLSCIDTAEETPV